MLKMTQEQRAAQMQDAADLIRASDHPLAKICSHLEEKYGATFRQQTQEGGKITTLDMLGLTASAWRGQEMAIRNWVVRAQRLFGID